MAWIDCWRFAMSTTGGACSPTERGSCRVALDGCRRGAEVLLCFECVCPPFPHHHPNNKDRPPHLATWAHVRTGDQSVRQPSCVEARPITVTTSHFHKPCRACIRSLQFRAHQRHRLKELAWSKSREFHGHFAKIALNRARAQSTTERMWLHLPFSPASQ